MQRDLESIYFTSIIGQFGEPVRGKYKILYVLTNEIRDWWIKFHIKANKKTEFYTKVCIKDRYVR